MEQIPMEVIEMAEDFFNHASEEEQKNMLQKYYNEQPQLFTIYTQIMKVTKDKTVVKRITNAFLTTRR